MFQDILRESSVYQEIVEEGRIQEQRKMLLMLVQLRFPELEALAKQQSDGIISPEILPPVNFKLLAAQTIEEARQILLSINKSEMKHRSGAFHIFSNILHPTYLRPDPALTHTENPHHH